MALVNSLILLCIICLPASYSDTRNDDLTAKDGILIQNSSKDVEMGINSTDIFLVISEKVLNINNNEFLERYEIEYQQFIESKGKMIISEPVFLHSKTISVALEDISAIRIVNDKIQISYYNSPAIKFEDIMDDRGQSLLHSFYPSDIKKFVSYYNRNR